MKGALAFLLGIVLLILVIGFWTSSVAAPFWEVVVTNENGKPLSGVTVREVWENYSFENQAHRTDEVTGQSGLVTFPARQNTVSTNAQVFRTLDSIRHIKTHWVFGRYATVFVIGHVAKELEKNGKYAIATTWTGGPAKLHTHMVVFTSSAAPASDPGR